MLVAGSQLPGAGAVDAGVGGGGEVWTRAGAAPGRRPGVGEAVGGGRRGGRVLGDLADQAEGGGAGVLPVDVVAPEAGAAGVAGLLLGQRGTRGAGRCRCRCVASGQVRVADPLPPTVTAAAPDGSDSP